MTDCYDAMSYIHNTASVVWIDEVLNFANMLNLYCFGSCFHIPHSDYVSE